MGHKSKKKSHKSSKSKELDTKFGRYLDCHLADALTKALLTSPKLLDEFPQIVNALDKGEYINIDGISNIPARECLIEVFNNISIVRNDSQGHGWYRHAKNEKIASHILRVLGDAKVIKDPKKLESSEIQSSRIAPLQLLSMIQSFPNFVTEVPIIIDQILEGHAVQLDEISDDELARGVGKLFITLGLVHTDDGLDVPTGKREGDQVIDCLEHFEEIFKSYKRGLCGNHIQNKSDGYKSSSSTESVKSASSHSQSSNLWCNSDERNEEILHGDESDLEIGPSKIVVGPSVPSHIELEKSRLWMTNYNKDNESSDNEDGYGPQIFISDSGPVENNPIGYNGIDMCKPLPEVKQVNSVSNVHTREEWLLTPGESKSITEILSDPTKLTTRKFQMGKQAKKKAEELLIRNAFLKSQHGKGPIEEEVAMDCRPSLMDEHLAKRTKVEEPGSKVRRPFDREKDIVGQRKIGINEVKQLVENSRDLDSRFSKGGIQKNFM